MTQLSTVLHTLRSYVEGLDDSGVTGVPLAHPFDPPAPEEKKPQPSPRQHVTPKPMPKREEPEPMLPHPASPRPVATPEETPRLVWVGLNRMAECGDSIPASETRLLLVTEQQEMEAEHRVLLGDMLKAIGYALPEASTPLNEPSELSGEGARILAMGNTALQRVSTAGMDLNIVRGMWQQSPWGKLISTFPPSYLHDNPPGKKAAWGDLRKILADLKLELPPWTLNRLKKK